MRRFRLFLVADGKIHSYLLKKYAKKRFVNSLFVFQFLTL